MSDRAAIERFFEEIAWIAPWDARKFADVTQRLHKATLGAPAETPEANQALISELVGALELSRHSIAAAPDDTWGTASAGDDEWPVAAEILAKIDAALAKARAK